MISRVGKGQQRFAQGLNLDRIYSKYLKKIN